MNIQQITKWKLAILTGVLVGLSYPPLHLGFLVWIGFIPLIHVLLNSKVSSAAKYGFLSSITANFISLYWIGFNSGAGFWVVFASLVAAVLYLGVFWAGMSALLTRFHLKTGKGIILIPFLWVAMEWLRSMGSLGFPWITLALTQTQFLPLIQLAEITGTYGVSFWIMMLNIGGYLTLTSKQRMKPAILTFGLFGIIWFSGVLRISDFDVKQNEKDFTVSVVQPNIDPNEKWEREHRLETFFTMHSLLDTALIDTPNLVLWPETALPAYLRLSWTARKPLLKRLKLYDVPLLSGTMDVKRDSIGERRYYNASILLNPDGTHKMYYKVQLVPFAEYIPLSGQFPSLKKLNFGQGNFNHGDEFTVFEVDSVFFSNVICYESSLPQLVRKFVKKGARLMTIQANDGWLGNTSGPYQHFELARLRAVENRVPVIRSANTGISGIILSSGRVKNKIPVYGRTVITETIFIPEDPSYYAVNGDKFAMLSMIISLLMMGIFPITDRLSKEQTLTHSRNDIQRS